MSIISILMAIVMPIMNKVRYQAKTVVGINNQRQVVLAVNCFAADNDEGYPESVATVKSGGSEWEWEEPTMMTACNPRSLQKHRSMSSYLHSYIEDASILFLHVLRENINICSKPGMLQMAGAFPMRLRLLHWIRFMVRIVSTGTI